MRQTINGQYYSLEQERNIMDELRKRHYDMIFASQYVTDDCKFKYENLEYLNNILTKYKFSKIELLLIRDDIDLEIFGNISYIALHSPEPYRGIAYTYYKKIVAEATSNSIIYYAELLALIISCGPYVAWKVLLSILHIITIPFRIIIKNIYNHFDQMTCHESNDTFINNIS